MLPSTLVVVRGAASSLRLEAEPDGIARALQGTNVQIVHCVARNLEETLLTIRGRVWLHLVGHVCSFRGFEEILSLPRLTREIVPVNLSVAEFRKVTESVELVFCNSSNTKAIADALETKAFGWSTACVEEGAVLFAHYFYSAVVTRSIDDAFRAAQQAIAQPPQPQGTSLKPCTLVGIGEAKIAKLGKLGITTIEALAWVDVNNPDLAVAATGNRRWDEAMQTLTRWRDTANRYLDNRVAHELRAMQTEEECVPAKKKRKRGRPRKDVPCPAACLPTE